MTESKRSLIQLKAYSRHGDIYRWLRENFDRVEPEIVHLKRSWESIASDIGADGVKGGRGKEPYANSVRRIWPRVCRDVAVAREREAEERRSEKPRPKSGAVIRRGCHMGFGHSGRRSRSGGCRRLRQELRWCSKWVRRRLSEEEEQKILAERLPDGRLTPAARKLKIARARRRLRKKDLWLGSSEDD